MLQMGSCNLWDMRLGGLSGYDQILISGGLGLSLLVKLPSVPVHLWLPSAHTEAPTVGSIILAGVVLKVGAYGWLRFILALCPMGLIYWGPLLELLGCGSILIGSLGTLRQVDVKRIVAYSSVAHMGLFTVALVAVLEGQALIGLIGLLVAHGLISGLLFLALGLMYGRLHSRLVKYIRGLAGVMPLMALILLLALLGNMAFPGFMGFAVELVVLVAVFREVEICG